MEDWFLDLCFEWKYKKIHYAMYSGRQNFYLRVGIDVDEGDDEKFKGLESS